MPPLLDRLLTTLGHLLPSRAVSWLFRRAVEGDCVALCLHRVRASGGDAHAERYSYPPERLDALISSLLATRAPAAAPWLTVSFDDGYADAAEYVATRAARFPQVEWLFFVCPEKAEGRGRFGWDAREVDCRLADLAQLHALGALPGVALGNHTNAHARLAQLDDALAQRELARSSADFIRLLGPLRHFAFPFGTPGAAFTHAHVAMLRAMGSFLLWSTERRPYAPAERQPGAVLPRFVVEGGWSERGVMAWMAVHALRFRVLGTRHFFPSTAVAARPCGALHRPGFLPSAAPSPPPPARAAFRQRR